MDIKSVVRQLRNNQTPAENLLWEKIRGRKFLNLKFVRQYPIIFDHDNKKHFYVADFYCHDLKLVLELDGKIHDYMIDRDQFRDHIINYLGFTVLRFKNKELFNNINGVLEEISSII